MKVIDIIHIYLKAKKVFNIPKYYIWIDIEHTGPNHNPVVLLVQFLGLSY